MAWGGWLCLLAAGGCIVYCLSRSGRQLLYDSIQPGSSEIDWCEDNYVHSDRVAEWWNATSSLLMLPVAIMVARMVFSLGQLKLRPQSAFLVIGTSRDSTCSRAIGSSPPSQPSRPVEPRTRRQSYREVALLQTCLRHTREPRACRLPAYAVNVHKQPAGKRAHRSCSGRTAN